MSLSIKKYYPLVLGVFHIIGLFLFLQSGNIDLTWMNLLLCGTLIFLTETESKKALAIFLVIFSGGFLIELIGTQTGYLFGNYEYGEVLGWKLAGVSLIIGVNWYAIVLASASLVRFLKMNIFLQAILAGLLCVGMDFIIEPVAINYGFWSWEGNEIPLFNYITWFLFACLFSYLYLKNSAETNKTAAWLYLIWILFFIILNRF